MLKLKTKGRDLNTAVVDIEATEGLVIDPGTFHAAAVYFPEGVSEVKLRSSDATPVQGIRTVTVRHPDDGVQRQVSVYNPVSGVYRVFNVFDKSILVLGLLRYKGECFYYRVECEVI